MTTLPRDPTTDGAHAPPRDEPSGLDLSLLRERGVRILIGSRMATKLGIATLSYGGMVYLARTGAQQWELSLVGAVAFVSALTFGLQGGIIADTLPKRTALVAGYALQAALCFALPTLLGVNLVSLVVLVFAAALVGQIVSPALKAAIALVTSTAGLASVAALTNVAGGVGSAFGSALLAPLLIKLFDVQVVMYAAGAILAFGAIRAFKLPTAEPQRSIRDSLRQIDWRPHLATPHQTAEWILKRRGIAHLILVGAIVAALGEGINSMQPVYVRDVLHADPTNSIYIFAPGALGYLLGMVGGPWMIDRFGERRLALTALGSLALGSMLFGVVDQIAPVLAPINPVRMLAVVGVHLSDLVLAAGMVAILTSFGSTAAGAAVLTFVNRRVPVDNQGAVFGMQEVIENGMTIVALLGLGALASALGTRIVYMIAPPLIVSVGVWLLRYSAHAASTEPLSSRDALNELFRSPDPGEAG